MNDCTECGFSYELEHSAMAGPAIREGVGELAAIIQELGSDALRRREPNTWSRLEYGCHVRDVLIVQRERILLARRVTSPRAEPMGRDERGEHDGYAEQDPAEVALQMRQAGALFVNVLTRLQATDWDRTLIYTYPTVAERSLHWVAVHTQHEVVHHLLDVKGQLRNLPQRDQ